MKATSIVEGFKVVENSSAGDFFGFENTVFREAFAFEAREERLAPGVIPTVPGATHTLAQAECVAELAEFIACILAASITMKEGSGSAWLSGGGLGHGCAYEPGLHVFAELPTEEPSPEHIDYDGQIEPAFAGGDVGDIASVDLARRGRLEVLKEIWCGGSGAVLLSSGRSKGAARGTLNTFLLHDARNSVFGAWDAARVELWSHAGAAVALGVPVAVDLM